MIGAVHLGRVKPAPKALVRIDRSRRPAATTTAAKPDDDEIGGLPRVAVIGGAAVVGLGLVYFFVLRR